MATIYYDRLLDQLLKVFREISLPGVPCPEHLYHYTTDEKFPKIISDNRLRAYSADSQRKDETEIIHGCELLGELLESELKSVGLSNFTRSLLEHLKFLPGQRRSWVFLACFSSKNDNERLWEKFRSSYCLVFETDPLRYKCVTAPRGLASGQGFWTELAPVIYDRKKQTRLLVKALKALIAILEDTSIIQGISFGPWTSDMVRFTADTLAEFLLSLVVRFKSKEFSDEYEWRVIARPNRTHFSSDAREADKNCECYVKKDGERKYIEMSGIEPEVLIRPGEPIFGLDVSNVKLPIREVVVGPKLSVEMFDHTRLILSDCGRRDVRISKSRHAVKNWFQRAAMARLMRRTYLS